MIRGGLVMWSFGVWMACEVYRESILHSSCPSIRPAVDWMIQSHIIALLYTPSSRKPTLLVIHFQRHYQPILVAFDDTHVTSFSRHSYATDLFRKITEQRHSTHLLSCLEQRHRHHS